MSTKTEAERDARREAERQRAAAAVEALKSSDGWQAWLWARSKFHNYSFSNQLLIAMQCPEATHVTGFRKWLELGYCVRRGETALWIWMPVPPSRKAIAEWEAAGAHKDKKPRTRFRMGPVFDTLSRDLWCARSRGLSRREPGLLASSLEWSRGGAGEEPGGPDTLLGFLEGL